MLGALQKSKGIKGCERSEKTRTGSVMESVLYASIWRLLLRYLFMRKQPF